MPLSTILTLSAILTQPYVFPSSASSLACGVMNSLASLVKTEAMGVAHIHKFNLNCVSKTFCCNISVSCLILSGKPRRSFIVCGNSCYVA